MYSLLHHHHHHHAKTILRVDFARDETVFGRDQFPAEKRSVRKRFFRANDVLPGNEKKIVFNQ